MSNTVVNSNVASSIERKSYVAPVSEVVRIGDRPLMVIVSPGVGSDYNPGDVIDAKKSDLNIEFRDMWEE